MACSIAGPGRRVRLGDAHRQDERAGAVVAVGRLDLEAFAVRALDRGGSPSSGSRTGLPPGPLGEGDEVGLHLRAATGNTTCHPSARAGWPCNSGPRRAGCSSRSARTRATRAGPVRAAWSTTASLEERPAAEHPASRRVGRDDCVVDPQRAQRVRDLERSRRRSRRRRPGIRPAGTASAQLRHRFAARSRRACAWSIRYITRGLSTRNGSKLWPGRTRQRSGRERDHVGDRASHQGGRRPRRRSRRGRAGRARRHR